MITSTQTEQRILETARLEFETKGYDGTRMQKIADAAGISKASLHYYFTSKDKLFETIFDQALEEYIPIVNTWTDDRLQWEDKLKRFTEEVSHFIRNGRMLFIIREVNRNPDLLTKHIKNKEVPNRVVSFFSTLISKNEINNMDPRLFYIFLNSLCCFPVINREMFQKTLRMESGEYEELMQSYSASVAEFFINAIKKKE